MHAKASLSRLCLSVSVSVPARTRYMTQGEHNTTVNHIMKKALKSLHDVLSKHKLNRMRVNGFYVCVSDEISLVKDCYFIDSDSAYWIAYSAKLNKFKH